MLPRHRSGPRCEEDAGLTRTSVPSMAIDGRMTSGYLIGAAIYLPGLRPARRGCAAGLAIG
jgi:hypothetical protein